MFWRIPPQGNRKSWAPQFFSDLKDINPKSSKQSWLFGWFLRFACPLCIYNMGPFAQQPSLKRPKKRPHNQPDQFAPVTTCHRTAAIKPPKAHQVDLLGGIQLLNLWEGWKNPWIPWFLGIFFWTKKNLVFFGKFLTLKIQFLNLFEDILWLGHRNCLLKIRSESAVMDSGYSSSKTTVFPKWWV